MKPNGKVLALWTDNEPMIVESKNPISQAPIIAMNMSWVSSDCIGACWKVKSDGARLLANTLQYAAAFKPMKLGFALFVKCNYKQLTNICIHFEI